jgi:hypothetical protein
MCLWVKGIMELEPTVSVVTEFRNAVLSLNIINEYHSNGISMSPAFDGAAHFGREIRFVGEVFGVGNEVLLRWGLARFT